jgi:hypothetical protein
MDYVVCMCHPAWSVLAEIGIDCLQCFQNEVGADASSATTRSLGKGRDWINHGEWDQIAIVASIDERWISVSIDIPPRLQDKDFKTRDELIPSRLIRHLLLASAILLALNYFVHFDHDHRLSHGYYVDVDVMTY